MTTLGPFRFYTARRDYLEALRSYRPGTGVPVLGAPGQAHELVARFSDAEELRPRPEYGKVLVAWPRRSRVRGIAGALAVSIDAATAELDDPRDIGPASTGTDYVVMVGLADEVSERWMMLAHDALWQRHSGGTGGHLGVLVAANARDLSWLIAKGLAMVHRCLPAEEHVRIWPAVQGKPRRYGEGRWVLRDEANADRVGPVLTATHTGALSMIAHGRDDVIHLDDTVICSTAAQTIDADDPAASHAPVCAFTGQCYRPEVASADIIAAGNVRADAVFANSCMGMRVSEGLYPTDFLVPHGFIRGFAAAYLGTGQIVNGLLKLNDIFHVACATGRSLGEAATLINDHLRCERADLPYFTLLGLPWLTLSDSAGDDESWRSFLIATGDWRRDGAGLRAASMAVGVEELTGRSAHVIHASPRSAAILNGAVTERVDLSRLPALEVELQRIGRSMTNLDDIQFTGLKYSRQTNTLLNVRNQAAALANSLNVAALRGDATKIRRKLASITVGMESAEYALAQAVFERGMHSFLHYNDVWGETLEMDPPVLTEDPCPHCLRPLVRYRAAHPILARIARIALVCARCGMIRDADARSPVETLALETDELWHCGNEYVIRLCVQFENSGPPRAKVAAAVFMANGLRNGVTFPGPQLVEVDSGGSAELDVHVNVPAGARMHQEYVRGLVVAEGTLSFAMRPVWVRSETRESVLLPLHAIGGTVR